MMQVKYIILLILIEIMGLIQIQHNHCKFYSLQKSSFKKANLYGNKEKHFEFTISCQRLAPRYNIHFDFKN